MKTSRAIHSALVIWLGIAAATLTANELLSPTMRTACVGFCVVGLLLSFAISGNQRIRYFASVSSLSGVRPDRSQMATPKDVEIKETDRPLVNA